ncbi:MAG: hypothetical protein ACRELV_10555 [Longimicrobiales bacterium]
MEILILTVSDARLLAARHAEHGNSVRRMMSALREAGCPDAPHRLRALRRIERRFDVDLGALCHRFLHREDPETHALERSVLEYVAHWRCPVPTADAGPEDRALWIDVDRLRALRAWLEETALAPERDAGGR